MMRLMRISISRKQFQTNASEKKGLLIFLFEHFVFMTVTDKLHHFFGLSEK